MRVGKLTTNELNESVINLLKKVRSEVKCSASVGEDCALIDGEGLILISSDPITAPVKLEKLGSLCVSVCCNDIASNGGEPIAMTLTLIMPTDATATDVKTVMQGTVEQACELNVEIVGGHTEFSDCVIRPIICGTAIGKTTKPILKTSLKSGEKLLVTKMLGMEGTCIIVEGNEVSLTDDEKATYESFSKSLSVTKESEILRSLDCIGVMHDVTEGGILGAVAEICHTQKLGATLYSEKMPLASLTKRLCGEYGINPLRLISSGSMLISTTNPDLVISTLSRHGIKATEIGEVTTGKTVLVSDEKLEEFEVEPDELLKINGEKQ
ncbi:MAG: AIR synthase [Clostridia bacterium]|nr:AIR synthase [Clostridia bacterium]